jgi:hypothetical protein
MPFVFFHEYFPEIAERETRNMIVLEASSLGLPPARYSLVEMFCDEPGCDCRRVFFYVISSRKKGVEAVIAWGWESLEFYARWMTYPDPESVRELQGPILNFGSPQSEFAPALLEIVRDTVLKDGEYVERLKRHYRMFRDKIDRRRGTSRKKRKRKK